MTWLRDNNTHINKKAQGGNCPDDSVVSAEFKAMAQGKFDYSVNVIPITSPKHGTMMCVCSDEAAIYITKEQAAKFFRFEH